MHENASKCMQNELCKGFVHKIIKEVHFITFKGAKINEIHLPLYGGTPCRLATLKNTIEVRLFNRHLEAFPPGYWRWLKYIILCGLKSITSKKAELSNFNTNSRGCFLVCFNVMHFF